MTGPAWKRLVRRWGAALTLAAMVIVPLGVTMFIVLRSKSLLQPDAVSTPPTAVTPAPKMPEPHEFAINIVVSDEQCPPEGDCVYTYSVEPKYIGLHPLPEDPFTVKYQVTGGREPQDGSFSVYGSEARSFKDVKLEGPAGAQLSAKATQVVLKPVFGPPATTPVPQG